MNAKSLFTLALVLVATFPLSAGDKKKNGPERGMLEKMEAVPCGAKERGVTGFGSVWASVGVTHVDSNEKLCPQYLLRTDDMEYDIRPTDGKHPVILPVGHEGVFKIKKDRMFLKFEDGDRKTRTYLVVSENPTSSQGQAQEGSKDLGDKP